MKKNKHHYVPKFYLRLFASDRLQSHAPKLINLYNIKNNLIVENASLRDQCYRRKFYGHTNDLEDAFASFEGECSKLISRILKEENLFHKGIPEYVLLLTFVVFQYLRTKRQTDEQNELFDSLCKTLLEENIDHFTEDDWAEILGKDVKPLTKDELKNNKITLENSIFISLSRSQSYINAINDLEPLLILIGSHQHFVVSDNPVVNYNQYYQDLKELNNTGLVSRGLQLFLPLSPHCLLILYDKDVYSLVSKQRKIYGITDKDLHFINLLQYINSDQNIYFDSSEQINNVISLGNNAKRFLKNRKAETLVFDSVQHEKPNRDSVLLVSHMKTINIELSLSFMKIKRTAKRVPLRERLINRYREELPDELSQYEPPPKFPELFVRRRNDK